MLWALDQIADHYGAWAPGSQEAVCMFTVTGVSSGEGGGMGGGPVGGAGRGGGG